MPWNFLAVSWIDWLLGLSRVNWSDRGAALTWRYPLAAWGWVLLILAALALAAWSYHRLLAPRWGLIALAPVRAMVIVFVAVLLAGPTLLVRRDLQEIGWVLLMLDRSASMKIVDARNEAGDEPADDEPVSRDAALRQALRRQAAVFGPEQLGRGRRLLWLGFDTLAYQMQSPLPDTASMPAPEGRSTALRTVIEQGIEQLPGQRVLGLVLFSDGRSPQSTGAELVRRLRQRGVGVYTVPFGGATTPLDLAISQVDAPDKAFIHDEVPITIWIDHGPQDLAIDPAHVVVRLIDPQRPDEPLDERNFSGVDLDGAIHLNSRWPVVGPVTWRVEVEYSDPDGNIREALTEDNVQQITIEFVDRPVRVLYVEGAPRWEYRYLKNLLLREKSIQSSVFLTSADRGFAQEGDEPITRLPHDTGEFAPYDVIIIGDVSSDYLSRTQLNLIRDQVSVAGAGLLWIGGPTHTPVTYEGTPLADLLPMRRPAGVTPIDARGGCVVTPSPLAEALSVMRLVDPSSPAQQRPAWPDELVALQWVQDLGVLKPTAETLAEAVDQQGERWDAMVTMRYGAGQVLYVGTDETWRWRHGRGALYHEQFWAQLIQMMGRGRIQQDWRPVRLSASHRRVQINAPVLISLTIEDEALLKYHLPKVDVVARRSESDTDADRIELVPRDAAGDDNVETGRPVRYEALWRPGYAGRFMLRVDQPQFDDLDMIWGPILVTEADGELRQRLADHDRLKRLAEETGGRMVKPDELGRLAEWIPQPDPTANDVSESLWDSPLALIVVVILLTCEWLGRKWIRLA